MNEYESNLNQKSLLPGRYHFCFSMNQPLDTFVWAFCLFIFSSFVIKRETESWLWYKGSTLNELFMTTRKKLGCHCILTSVIFFPQTLMIWVALGVFYADVIHLFHENNSFLWHRNPFETIINYHICLWQANIFI